MLKIQPKVDNLEGLKKVIDYAEKMSKMATNKNFQEFIQDKCLRTVESITNQRLSGGTTNDEEIGLYISSHKIESFENGFILYNDAKIPADKYNTLPFDTSGYPNGEFSIALAFEYGVGVVGITGYGLEKGYAYNDLFSSKSKSHQKLIQEWYLPNNVMGESGILTGGYSGFEIYRYTAIEIENNLKKWIDEFYEGQGDSK